MKALWRRQSCPFLPSTMLVLDLRSWVDEVTEAVTWPLLSRSMIILFFESCSWIRMTFSAPWRTHLLLSFTAFYFIRISALHAVEAISY